jgi:hypothetical protein
VAVLLVLIALALLAPAAQARPLDRPDDPVVLTGAATPSLTGAGPGVRLCGHRRIALVVRLRSGQRVTLRVSVRALC